MQITTLPKDDVKRGEIYYISRGGYNTGSEQQADRPGVIVSNDKNNKNSQTLEVVYLTTQPKNELPTHCTIRSTGRVSTVLCEQIHTVAVERIGKYIGVCTAQKRLFRFTSKTGSQNMQSEITACADSGA